MGLPDELRVSTKKIKSLFGFPDTFLGEHVARAYHALALNEMRKDFVCFRVDSIYLTYLTNPLTIGLHEVPSNREGKAERADPEAGMLHLICNSSHGFLTLHHSAGLPVCIFRVLY